MADIEVKGSIGARRKSLEELIQEIVSENRYLESVANEYMEAQIRNSLFIAALITDVLEGRMQPEPLKKFKHELEKSAAESQEDLDWNRSIDSNAGTEHGNTSVISNGRHGGDPADHSFDQQHEKPPGELRQIQGPDRGFVYTAHETRNFF